MLRGTVKETWAHTQTKQFALAVQSWPISERIAYYTRHLFFNVFRTELLCQGQCTVW